MTATAFCLHALGSSSEEFAALRARLSGTVDLVGIDLPGFGSSSAVTGTTVEEMAVHVERAIGTSGATEWALVGHSMGGKVASVVAGRTMSGANGLFGLRAVVLLAASPLSPEPMDEERRASMLAWAADHEIGPDEAAEFVDANTADRLAPEPYAMAVHDVRRADPAAWTAWLLRGSREDWSDAIAPSPVPALVLAGAEDGDLGPDAQREVNLPHWPRGEFDVVPGAAHLLPWEQPDAVADRIRSFWERRVDHGPAVPAASARIIASPRVSAKNRGVLAARALPDDPAARPRALSVAQLDTLRAVARVVVPQPAERQIDLAIRVDAQLADGLGDGWRVDGLPADADAYRAALDVLAPEAAVSDERLADVLDAVDDGTYTPAGGILDGGQLRAWFEDAGVDLVKQWLAHPATMAAIDYDGFANGGDGVRKQGFQLLGAGQREAWEPDGATP
ncbi:alpha/beta fold hydrolase [Curtobacterium herbarum]|uniref:AB hydrolase-1 domain-containing protein n=1 Tax=Curtobacterium herbarum TaxID=150122 RepID=A0ABP4JZQ1_9MICO|nr:alpha/beta hydrolase [Curtobacterium herbarum]MBM7476362.1 pimeloyl-ACP methyl ester carboxylesterase [Curtobacterium herbarum]MCS6544072.1 alpha/beta hydrolase [Curtobacterium herbarum]